MSRKIKKKGKKNNGKEKHYVQFYSGGPQKKVGKYQIC